MGLSGRYLGREPLPGRLAPEGRLHCGARRCRCHEAPLPLPERLKPGQYHGAANWGQAVQVQVAQVDGGADTIQVEGVYFREDQLCFHGIRWAARNALTNDHAVHAKGGHAKGKGNAHTNYGHHGASGNQVVYRLVN